MTGRQLKQVEQEVSCKDKLESSMNNCSCKFPGAKLEAVYFELVQGCVLSSMVQTAGGHSRLQPIKQIKNETQDAKIKVNYEKKWMKQIVQTEFLHCVSSVEPHSVVVTFSKLFYWLFCLNGTSSLICCLKDNRLPFSSVWKAATTLKV